MPRYYSGNITLYTDTVQANSPEGFAETLQQFITEAKHLPAYQKLITRYGINITYASAELEKETKTNA